MFLKPLVRNVFLDGEFQISELTYKVVAKSDLTTLNGDDCVDWAIEMLQLGHETPSLLILAGLWTD